MNALPQPPSSVCPSCNTWRNRCHSRRVLGVLSAMPKKLFGTVGVQIPMSNKCHSPASEFWQSSSSGQAKSLPHRASPWWNIAYGCKTLHHCWRVLVRVVAMPSKLPLTVGVHIPMPNKCHSPAGGSCGSSLLFNPLPQPLSSGCPVSCAE